MYVRIENVKDLRIQVPAQRWLGINFLKITPNRQDFADRRAIV